MTPIHIGDATIDKLMVNGTEIASIYLGDKKITQ